LLSSFAFGRAASMARHSLGQLCAAARDEASASAAKSAVRVIGVLSLVGDTLTIYGDSAAPDSPLRLDVAELRRRLASRGEPEFTVFGDDGTEGRDAASTAAAVLIPVITHGGHLTVLFTKRTSHLKSHSGQVSFPGGRAEAHDPSAEFTALREAQEEIGLAPERVEIIGRLPDYRTRTGFRVTPVVGLVAPPLELTPDPNEVDEIFEVPLDFLLDPANRQRHTRELQGRSVGFYVFEHGGRTIWGATAGMLVNLYRMLA
jgi:8-oxo-dGTP pyrophosphatase MutT (NUDIX family)